MVLHRACKTNEDRKPREGRVFKGIFKTVFTHAKIISKDFHFTRDCGLENYQNRFGIVKTRLEDRDRSSAETSPVWNHLDIRKHGLKPYIY